MVELTSENFKSEVLETKGKVIVMFYRETCNDCKTMREILDGLDGLKVCQINGDTYSKIRESYFLRNSPAILFFENGKIYNKQSGGCTEQRLRAMVDERLDGARIAIDKPISEMSVDEMKVQLHDLRKYADPMWQRVQALERAIKEKEL
jgi:thioredoxin 1